MTRLACIALLAGCAHTMSVGTRAVDSTNRRGHSIEATAAIGAGLGDEDSAMLYEARGGLGAAPGGAQGRIAFASEWIRFGERHGWQLHGATGLSVGAYQSPDATFEVGGGPHWNLVREHGSGELRVTSVALDATIGYAFRGDTESLTRDGAFAGLALSLRRDRVSNLGWKPFE